MLRIYYYLKEAIFRLSRAEYKLKSEVCQYITGSIIPGGMNMTFGEKIKSARIAAPVIASVARQSGRLAKTQGPRFILRGAL